MTSPPCPGRRSSPIAARVRPGTRWSAALRAVVCAAAVFLSGAAFPDDAGDLAKLRAAMERAYVAAEADHARVRRDGFTAALDGFAADLAAAVASAAAEKPADDAARETVIARTAASLAGAAAAPLSETSLRVVLAEMLPADLSKWPKADTQAAVRDAFATAAKTVFGSEKFPDCWDAHFLGLPEVAAWRKAHEKQPDPPPAGPDAKRDPPAEKAPDPPTHVTPPHDAPPEKVEDGPPSTELPSPFAADPAQNLVPIDRTRGWVGPWTGWTQEIPERDNHRQRRPAKFVYMARYETTCADYVRFLRGVDASKRRALLPVGWTIDDKDEPAFPPGRERHPVTNVTFFQAQAYAESRGERLPTEDEWDRAAGGGEKVARAFPWGDDPAGKKWAFAGQGADAPTAVDAFPDDRSPEGIVGLAGNVAEMVATMVDRRDVPAKLQPSQQVVVRGGGWRTPRASECSATYRWVIDAGEPAPNVGFRCVMDEADYKKRFK